MNNGLISIITPIYNSALYINDTIQSVLNQDYTNWELILIDNNSNDSSLGIIGEYLGVDNRIKIIKLDKNYGPAKARNEGIKMSRGRYICFLDSDDVWDSNFLKEQIDFLNEKNATVVYSSFYRKSEDLIKNYGAYNIKEKVTYKNLLKKNYLSCLTSLIDIEKTGKFYFNENIKHEDHLYWIQLLKEKNYIAYGNSMILATYRIRKKSLSRNKLKAATWKWNIYRNELNFGLIKSLYYFICYSFYGVISNYKYILPKRRWQ